MKACRVGKSVERWYTPPVEHMKSLQSKSSGYRYLVLGGGFLLLGFVLLMWTLGLLHRLSSLWPLVPIIIGSASLIFGFHGMGPEASVFVGIFLTVGGVFFLMITTVMSVVEITRVWPVFMTIAGVSLGVFSFHREPGSRMSLLVPSIVIILLSAVFFLFSLDIVQQDFIAVVTVWWPILFVAIGVGIILFHLLHRNDHPNTSE